jgi:L-asparaginase II
MQSANGWPAQNPILLEVMRGGILESVHRGAAAVVDLSGAVLRSWGDISWPVSPRSCMKLVNAIPFVEAGAVDAFGLGSVEIALACSSHVGAPLHVDLISHWLDKVGLTVADLQCGTHAPFSREASDMLVKSGRQPTALHNNNSGKHVALLTTAKHLGEPLDTYLGHDHPAQQRVRRVTEIMTGFDLTAAAEGVDRCGMPMPAMPLYAMARAMARFGRPDRLDPGLAASVHRILDAVREHPVLLLGPGKLSTVINQVTGGRIILKGGSEGTYAGCVPERGLGFAIKIDDGGGDRAANIVVMNLLAKIGAFTSDDLAKLHGKLARPVLDARGELVGMMRAAECLACDDGGHVVDPLMADLKVLQEVA